MANTLATILNDSGGRAMVEQWLEKRFLERRDYDTVMANSKFAKPFRIPGNSGQYVKATRKNRFRMPQKVQNDARTSDPASGATMGVEQITLPMEYIQEFVPIGTIAQWTSWIDLEEWADEDLVVALRRRNHQLTQNAFKVGRFKPGKWAADGSADVAFDTTAEASPTIDGISFTFPAAVAQFVAGKPNFAALAEGDRFSMEDFEQAFVELTLAGAQKINGRLVAVISDSVKSDLMRDDKYFAASIHAFNGKGISENQIADYKGWHWVIDDEPFTEQFGAAQVRAANGPVHTACCFGANAFSYVRLGGKSKAKPTFKVQDVSKTGVEKTIGYTVPFQAAIVNRDWARTITGPVSFYKPNNS